MRQRLLAPVLSVLLASPALAHFSDGQIYVCDATNSRTYRVDPVTWQIFNSLDADDGLVAPRAIGLNNIDDMLLANYTSDVVLKFDNDLVGGPGLDSGDGLVGPKGGNAIVTGPDGSVYICNSDGAEILKFDAALTSGTVFADELDGLVRPEALAFAVDGTMLVCNRGTTDILAIDSAGNATVWDSLAGETPVSIAIRNNGDVFTRTLSGNVYRFTGGVPGSPVLLGDFGSDGGPGSLAFDPTYTILYTVSQNDNTLVTIDPDTGSSSVVINDPTWAPVALVVVGTQYAPGAIWKFGAGFPGTGFAIPSLSAQGTAFAGSTVTLETRDFVGGAYTVFVLGLSKAQTNFLGAEICIDLTGTWYQQPIFAPGTPGVAAEGDFDTPFAIPPDPSLAYVKWYVQQAAIDPGAFMGLSTTNCLTIYVGV